MHHPEWNTVFPLRFGADPDRQSSLCLVGEQDQQRALYQRFIQQRFNQAHGAQVSHFMPELLGLRTAQAELSAVCGARLAHSTELFLEQYLLIKTAIFSPAHGQLKVLLSADAESLRLSVEDQGPGIAAQELVRVFERFYSRDNSQGAGLGLAIVEMIASRLGGRIHLSNLPQGGLQASLELPRQPPA